MRCPRLLKNPHRIGIDDKLRTAFLHKIFASDRKVKVPVCLLSFTAENSDEGKTGQSKVAFKSVVALLTRARGRFQGYRASRCQGQLSRILLLSNQR